ncbi:probable pectinesterase/pectinesterase inhibitor 21 [Tanacetum coccineum]
MLTCFKEIDIVQLGIVNQAELKFLLRPQAGWLTAAIESGFITKSMGFRNTIGPYEAQAVALHSQSDKSSFFHSSSKTAKSPLPWQGTFALDTYFYGEYANVGGDASMDRRVKWKGFKVIKDKNEAMQYTAGAFVQENRWLKGTGAPFYLGLKG